MWKPWSQGGKKILPIEGDTQLVLAEWYEIIWTSNGDSLSQQGFFMRQSFKLCLLATPLLLNLHGTWCCTAPCGLVSCPSHPSLRSEGHHMSTVRSARQGHNPSLAGKSRFSFLSPPAHMAPGSAGFLMLPPGELEIRFFHVFFSTGKMPQSSSSSDFNRLIQTQISIDWYIYICIYRDIDIRLLLFVIQQPFNEFFLSFWSS